MLAGRWTSAGILVQATAFQAVILMGAAGYALTGALDLVARRLRP